MSKWAFWLTVGYVMSGERVLMLLAALVVWFAVWRTMFGRVPKNH